MRPITKRSVACLVTALFLISAIPSGVVAEEPVEHYAFGIEYDWSYLDDDATSLSGISIKDVLADISKAADDSGFELLLAQETTGTSSVIIDQYTGADTTYNFAGADVPATPHYTKLTIRHGLMADAAIMTEWHDSSATWDVTFTADSENILVMDILYVEYRNADNELMGAAIDQSMTFTQGIELGLIGTLTSEAYTDDDSGEQHAAVSLPLDVSFEVGFTYQIISNHADLVLGEASDLPNALKELDIGERLEWECSTDIESSSTNTETYDEGDSSDEGDGPISGPPSTTIHLKNPCESLTGAFSTKTSLNIQVSGLPAAEFGYPAGDWDIDITDSITDSGTYDVEEIDLFHRIQLEDGSAQTLTIDGESMDVLQADSSPFPFGFDALMEDAMAEAIQGSDDGMTIVDMLDGTILQEVGDEWASGLAEDSSNDDNYYDRLYFTCDDGQMLTRYSSEADADYYDLVNDGYSECGDGSDEGRQRVKVNFNWHEWENSPTTYIDLENYADDDDDPAKDMEGAHMSFSMYYVDTSITNNTNSDDSSEFTIDGSYEQLELGDLWPEYDYSSMYPEGIGGDICLTVKLYAEDNALISTGTDCTWVGDHPPRIDSVYFRSEGSDSFSGEIRVWELQEDADYEIAWQMKASDGTTVDAGSFVASESYNFEAVEDDERCDGVADCNILSGDINGWGEYCLSVEVNLVGGSDNPLATREECEDVQQEPEPSQKLIDLFSAFEQSTLENVMDSFEQNLDNRLEKYEEDFPYDDGELYTLWSKAEGKVVGVQLLAHHADSGNRYTLVGPESNIYPAAPVPIHVVYFSGSAAIAQETEIVDDTTLDTLVDLTKHNTAAVDAVAAGLDPSDVDTSDGGSDGGSDGTDDIIEAANDEGLLPFISPVATLAMIALAGMFVAIRRKD